MKIGSNRIMLKTPICFMYRLIACFIGLSEFHLSSQNPMSLEALLEGRDYSKDVRPFSGKHPVPIKVQILVLKISDIDERSLSFKITYILRQSWTDPRLTRNDSLEDIIYQAPANNLIWIPNIDIVSSDKTEKVKDNQLTLIGPKGDIYTSERMFSFNYCQMNLKNYPMDTQICTFRLEPYAYSAAQVSLSWEEVPVQLFSGLKVSGFVLVNAVSKRFEEIYTVRGKPLKWSNLAIDFHFRRLVLHVFFRTYLPIVLVIIFNMSSYWIPDSALPARCTMIITTFLTSAFILQNVSERAETSENTTALQFFITFSITIIVVAIGEYLVVLQLRTKKKMRILKIRSIKKLNEPVLPAMLIGVNGEEYTENDVKQMKIEMEDVHLLDKIFRILMPIIYLLFCSIYFGYYLSFS